MKSPKLRVREERTSALNPFTKHSLLGFAPELTQHARQQKPLLGRVCLKGEATVWYGRFGTGKTLFCLHFVIEAIQDGRVKPDNVIYINADDSSAGLAQKVTLLEDYAVHVVAQGHRGFRTSTVTEKMREMIANDAAGGVVLIFDTLKKFVDVMDKKATRSFNEVIRQFVMQGGTVLALAHTNKRPGPDGKPIPEGTGDVLNDFDCAFLLDTVGQEMRSGNTKVEFNRVKSRGPAVLKAYYAYDPSPDITYTDRLCSIREIEPDDDKYGASASLSADEAEIVETIELTIRHGTLPTKMDIVRMAAKVTQASRRSVLALLEKYTGDDPAVHRWNYVRQEHGRMVYSLIDGET